MSSLRIVPFAWLAAGLLGQTPDNAVPNPNAAIEQAVQGIGRVSLGLQPKLDAGWLHPAAQPPQPGNLLITGHRCSVPLLEMQIPDRTNFVILRVEPPTVGDNMKVTPGIPPCPGALK
jgi:hypothetical protein